MKDSHELARLCTLDLGTTITSEDVRTYLLTGRFPEHLTTEEQSDMMATVLKELATA